MHILPAVTEAVGVQRGILATGNDYLHQIQETIGHDASWTRLYMDAAGVPEKGEMPGSLKTRGIAVLCGRNDPGVFRLRGTYDILFSMKNIPIPKGILFDMDGVLLVAPQSSDQSWRHVSQQFAPLLDLSSQQLEEALRVSRDQHKREIEHDSQKQRRDRLEPFETRRETVERALERLAKGDTALATEMVHAFESFREKRQLSSSALDTLRMLRDRSLSLALISNGNAVYQRRKIEQHHLAPFFDVILIEQEFGVAKPDPRIFFAALNQLHITAQDAWMVGDDLAFDIAASQELHIFAIWCDLAKRGLPEESSVHPDRTIHALPELLDLLAQHS